MFQCLGAGGVSCVKMIVSLHFRFSFQACWNSSIPVVANVIQPCELWLVLKVSRHFPPRRAPVLLLLAACQAAFRNQRVRGIVLLQNLFARSLPAFCCLGCWTPHLLQAASFRVGNPAFVCLWGGAEIWNVLFSISLQFKKKKKKGESKP